MKKLLVLILLFITSCSPGNLNTKFDFGNDMSFDEFKIKLKDYANLSSYPNLDN